MEKLTQVLNEAQGLDAEILASALLSLGTEEQVINALDDALNEWVK